MTIKTQSESESKATATATMDPSRRVADPSPTDALLFATLCIVGLPVEIQIRDGSLFTGIFHTSTPGDNFDIVLKTARKIRSGKGKTNVAAGAVVDTLIVQSGDLVQLVVKDYPLAAEGVVSDLVGDDIKAAPAAVYMEPCNGDTEREMKLLSSAGNSPSRISGRNVEASLFLLNKIKDIDIRVAPGEGKVLAECLERMQEHEDGSQDNICHEKLQAEESYNAPSHLVNERQVREERPQGEKYSCNHIEQVAVTNTVFHEAHCSTPNDANLPLVNSIDETHLDISSKNSNRARSSSPVPLSVRPEVSDSEIPTSTNLTLSYANASTVSTSSTSSSVVDDNSSPYSTRSIPDNPSGPRENSLSKTSAKEFKLNPGAKIFLPSIANYRSAAAAPQTITNTDYMSNINPMNSIAGAQTPIEVSSFASRSNLPSKPVQYSNYITRHNVVSPQYSRPIVGLAGTRQQQVRLSGQFHPLQGGSAYIHPNSHAVMVGRLGQLMYIHPVPQDAIQGTPFLSQGSPQPLSVPYQANVPKLQDTRSIGSKDGESDWWRI